MFSPKMLVGMLNSFITDDKVKEGIANLLKWVQEKQAAAGEGVRFQLVLDPNDGGTEIYIRIWKHAEQAELIFNRPVSELTANDIKTFLNDFLGKAS